MTDKTTMEEHTAQEKPCLFTLETGKHDPLKLTYEYQDGYKFSAPKCPHCGWIDTEAIEKEVIKKRDQQWIEAVGKVEFEYGVNEVFDKFNHEAYSRNQLRHQIKDKMGLGEEVDLISPLVVE